MMRKGTHNRNSLCLSPSFKGSASAARGQWRLGSGFVQSRCERLIDRSVDRSTSWLVGLGMDFLAKVARRTPTAVSLENLWRFGKSAARDPRQRLLNAQFLHNELQIRIAQRVVELEALPLGLPHTRPIQDVIGWYSDYFELVAESAFPEDEQGEEDFSDILRHVLQDNSEVIETTSRGVLEAKRQMDGFTVEDQEVLDKVLNRFYLARIGLRFLIEHHITSREPRQGFAGIIQSDCRPFEYVQSAAEEAGSICEYYLGVRPNVSIQEFAVDGKVGESGVTFTYVPSHLQYILCEVFKNAFRAVTERHMHSDSLPPVQVTIVEGESDVTIRVSDLGGGIERSKLPIIWSYLHSTAEDPNLQQELLTSGRTRSVLAGYGVGLPLSRLYARYFGGDLDTKSLHGFGTDVFLNLPRLGHSCENLPAGVITSPGEGDSSIPRGASGMFFFGDRKSWKENAELGTAPAFVKKK